MKVAKYIFRKIWILACNFLILLNCKRKPMRNSEVKVFFGGAYSGDFGGPLVKVKRLKEFFPENYFNFNLVYCLSNTPYLSEKSLKALKKRNVPIILNQNGVYFKGWYGKNWEEKNRNLKYAYNAADYIFWQSEFCKKSAEKFLGTREHIGEVLYNAVDVNRFTPNLTKSNSDFTFLVAGKFDASSFYRLKGAIEAFNLLQKKNKYTYLKISGSVNKHLIEKATNLIISLGLSARVSFTGSYSQENAPEIYNSADALLMLKYMDASPNVVIEAMACGLPIIYSATGGIPELVGPDAGIGLLLKENWNSQPHSPDPALVSEAMNSIIYRKAHFAAVARQRAIKHFNMNNWIIKHKEVFNVYLNK